MAPDADFLLKALITGAFLINLAVGAVTLFATKRVQRREVTLAAAYASQTSFDAEVQRLQKQIEELNDDVGTMKRDMKTDRQEILAAGEVRAVKIHERINDLSNNVINAIGELRGELKRMS